MKNAALLAVCLMAGLLIASTADFPAWGDYLSPASRHVSGLYIERSYTDTATPNFVTAILADYRGFDTMLETTVVFIAAMACFLIIREPKESCIPRFHYYRHVPTWVVVRTTSAREPLEEGVFERIDSDWTPPNLIIVTICRLLIPFLQLFGLYVLAHGHYSPGGGFQAGVIFASSYILMAVSHDLHTLVSRLTERTNQILAVSGVLIYYGVGLVGLAQGGKFLDYGELAGILGMKLASGHSLGILLVETGVCITVTAALVIIYKLLSSEGTLTEGL